MVFDIFTYCGNDWEHMDGVESATFSPADPDGSLGTDYEVKVLRGRLRKPQSIGGRIASPGTHTIFEFWKALAESAPDPRPNDLLTVGSDVYVLDGVEDTRRSKWDLSATLTPTNVPAA